MAKVLRDSGRYVSQQASELRRRILLHIIAVIGFFGLLDGLLLSYFLPLGKIPPLVLGTVVFATLSLIWWFGRETERRLDAWERERFNYERGLLGESHVAQI